MLDRVLDLYNGVCFRRAHAVERVARRRRRRLGDRFAGPFVVGCFGVGFAPSARDGSECESEQDGC